MRIEFHCSHCSAVVKAEEELAGRTVRCPKCRRTFQLLLPKPQSGKKTGKSAKKKKNPPTPVVKLGGIFIIDNTGSPDIGKIIEAKTGDIPFKLPAVSAEKPSPADTSAASREPESAETSKITATDAVILKKPDTSQPVVSQKNTPLESVSNAGPSAIEMEEETAEVGVLDLPKFDLSAFEHQPPEFDDSVETPTPVVLDESNDSVPTPLRGKTSEKPTEPTLTASFEPTAEAKSVEKITASVPVPNSVADAKGDKKSAADPFMPPMSEPIPLSSIEGDSNLLSHMVTGLVILAGTAVVVVGGLRLLDSKRTGGNDSMADFQRTMEIAAKDPAGPFQTTTELIDGRMTLTHESETFISKSVEFDDMRIDIQRLRDEEFPDVLIKRYVESDTNSDGFVDDIELEKILHY